MQFVSFSFSMLFTAHLYFGFRLGAPREEQIQETALMNAAQCGHTDCLRVLLEVGGAQIEAKDMVRDKIC